LDAGEMESVLTSGVELTGVFSVFDLQPKTKIEMAKRKHIDFKQDMGARYLVLFQFKCLSGDIAASLKVD
jgi:hypothetical protein